MAKRKGNFNSFNFIEYVVLSRNLWVLYLSFISLFLNATSNAMQLKGSIQISVAQGTISAELIVSNLPRISDYSIWLNTGLNIEFIRDSSDSYNYYYNSSYDSDLSSEALQHYIPDSKGDGRFLPSAFKIKYTGKFPVISDKKRAYEWGDWKGNMAFNGRTFRASEQSVWYPVIYDRENDFVHNSYIYELEVICEDCASVYVNGDLPQRKSNYVFQSTVPVPLLIYCGAYEILKSENLYVLNSNIEKEKLDVLAKETVSMIHYYENKLQIPYGKQIVYLSEHPVSLKNEWMFVTYPTVAIIGVDKYSLENYFDNKTFKFKENSSITFLAHELAHYYLGTIFQPNSSMRWFFLEGIAEYLSLKYTAAFLGKEEFERILQKYIADVSELNVLPFQEINQASQINETMRYRYIPLLLLAFEKEFGEKIMFDWVSKVVKQNGVVTDYAFLFNSFKNAAGTDERVIEVLNRYLNSANAKQLVISSLTD